MTRTLTSTYHQQRVSSTEIKLTNSKTASCLTKLQEVITSCTSCPRLVKHRTQISIEKRRAYRDWDYWGRPVPSFGNGKARLLILGLAPGAHGANRTGRMFTGDRSGDFLYRALFKLGFCSQPTSRHVSDGLQLIDTYMTAAVRCAPPGNKPTPLEKKRCLTYLQQELALLKNIKVILALGAFAWNSYLMTRKSIQLPVPRPQPRFGHGAQFIFEETTMLIGSYHPSQQNTLTGRLTMEMLLGVLKDVRKRLDQF